MLFGFDQQMTDFSQTFDVIVHHLFETNTIKTILEKQSHQIRFKLIVLNVLAFSSYLVLTLSSRDTDFSPKPTLNMKRALLFLLLVATISLFNCDPTMDMYDLEEG